MVGAFHLMASHVTIAINIAKQEISSIITVTLMF